MQNKLTSTCQYQSIFSVLSGVCPHPPLEGDRDKSCVFHSRDYKKDKGAFWEGIQDKLKAEDFDFTGYYFPPGLGVDFGGKKFKKDAIFRSAIFKGDVNFSKAEFLEGITDFSMAEFSGESTVFSEAEFSGESTGFRRAGFSGESTNFSGAKFLGKDTDFGQVVFFGCGTVRFVDTVFKGECKFLEVKFPFRPDQFVIFAGTRNPIDLGNTVFLYSNYDRLTFRNCKFPEGPDELFGRMFPDWQGWKRLLTWRRRVILKDEKYIGKMLELKKKEREGKGAGRGTGTEVGEGKIAESVRVEYSHVESLYRQFKKNLEAEKDWELAGEFHYGEMECKRKGITSQWPQLKWLRQKLGLLAWYKYFSGYGERSFRTFCWIVFLLPIFAGFYYWLDLQPRQDFVYYLWELSVKAAFLQRIGETGNEPIRALGKFFYLLQSVLCPTLIALFILALRRRVRR